MSDNLNNIIRTIEDSRFYTITKNDSFVVVYDKEKDELTINSNIPLNLQSNTNLKISVNGKLDIDCEEFSLVAEDKISIDSKLPEQEPSIFLNSKMARQIRHSPESEEYRNAKFKEYVEEIVLQSFSYYHENEQDYINTLYENAEKSLLSKYSTRVKKQLDEGIL